MGDREYIISERRRREVCRSLDEHEDVLKKTRKLLEAQSLTEGMKEIDGRISDTAMLKRQFSIQSDMVPEPAPPGTPLEEEIAAAEANGASSEPKVGTLPEVGTRIAWPDGTHSDVTQVLGYDSNREAFEVIDSREGARHIFLEPIAKEWRVLALVLEYPFQQPMTGPLDSVVEDFEGAPDTEGSTESVEPPAPERDSITGEVKDAKVSLTARRREKAEEPEHIGETTARVTRAAESGKKVASATGERRVPLVGKGKKKR